MKRPLITLLFTLVSIFPLAAQQGVANRKLDDQKKVVERLGRQLAEGEPLGFFPAGAMSKVDWHGHLVDRPWQKSILQLIYKAKVPVIPIYFHGSNSWWFNILGHICWPARSLRLPAEVFRKTGKTMHISVGRPITLADQEPYRKDFETLGAYLREQTYKLRDLK